MLIMVGLISGVLFQALERAYRLQSRFGAELFKVQHGQMAVDWYRQTVQGLYPDQPDGQNLFHGDSHGFSGLSNNPLDDDYGAPTPIAWRIKSNQQSGGNTLTYIAGQRETPILIWHGNQAHFIYLDELLARHDSWPPPLGLFPQLPKQIQLEASDAGEPLVIVASPMGPTTPLVRPQDIFRAQTPGSPKTSGPTGFIP